MRLRHSKQIESVSRYYESILRAFDNKPGLRSSYVEGVLEDYGVSREDEYDVREEYDVSKYLYAIQIGFNKSGEMRKPDKELFLRVFTRYHKHVLELRRVDPLDVFLKDLRCCEYYLKVLSGSSSEFYDKLPDTIRGVMSLQST